MSILNQNRNAVGNYTVQRRTRLGRQFIVVPVVMMVEGVHSGSHGAILHTNENLSDNPSRWNGSPITDGHPKIDGKYVSANNPEINSIGNVYNVHWDDKLKGEAWIDVQLISQFAPTALAYINQGRAIDVSVGVFSDTIQEQGEWNGENYVGVASNYRPDHLALLPGEEGACSWNDGCGIRNNQKNKSMKTEKENQLHDSILTQINEIQNNEVGYQEMSSRIRSQVDSWDNEFAIHYLHEIYDNYFIYRKEVRRGSNQSSSGYYKQNYTKNETTVVLNGEPIKVTMEFKEIQSNEDKSIINQTKGEKQMNKAKNCCPDKIEALIANEQSRFTEDDREWLGELSPENLAKMEPKFVRTALTDESVRTYIAGKEQKDVILLLPTEVQANVQAAFDTVKQLKDQKIEKIMANSKEWTKEELEVLADNVLDKISKTTVIEKTDEKEIVDYSAARGGQEQNKKVVGTVLPAGVK